MDRPTLSARLVTEGIGTFFLMLVIVLAVGQAPDTAALIIGLGLAALIYMGGPVSGAHYNPAATLGFWMRRAIGTREAFLYVGSQLVGALGGAWTGAVWMGGEPFRMAVGTSVPGVSALLAEVAFTFLLVLVILQVALAARTRGNPYYGIAIGLTVTAGIVAVGGISGAAFNPVVALAALIVEGRSADWAHAWVWGAGPLAGSLLAAFVFRIQEGPAHLDGNPRDTDAS
ncbi:MAG: aquaporin [Bacteroidetes bacterium]|nr:aquaporin [Bacteroidota bacterium]MDA0874822.1 aquaporin [Bacteroidota bacterium]